MATSLNNSKRSGRILAGFFMSACVLMFCANDAMAQRGGGGRGGGGGGGGASRGGGGNSGGRTASASVSGGNRSSASGNAANRSGGNRQASTANRSGNTANRSTSNSGNRSVNNSGNRTNNGNINTGDVNVNRNVNVDVEGGYGCCRNGVRYPVAAAVTIGAIAGTTAAVVAGSYYNALPSNCATIIRGGASYYQCGSAYYQQSMNGDNVVYMAVDL